VIAEVLDCYGFEDSADVELLEDVLHAVFALIEDKDSFVAVVIEGLHALPHLPLYETVAGVAIVDLARGGELHIDLGELEFEGCADLLDDPDDLQVEGRVFELPLQPIVANVRQFDL
jgi:hypothetical protein